ncbi:MAG TPA: PepSY domain-containing protein [Kofleriaceae bacterium]|jgi:uncharacterized membrane protein YkoI|nr:PepSY domain-containing protein [Kofleriaceae bacterium]
MKTAKVMTALMAAAIGVGGFALAHAQTADQYQQEKQGKPKKSMKEAEKAALKEVPGKVIDHKLETEQGRNVYSFDIQPKGASEGTVKQVEVDANTGKVMSVDNQPVKGSMERGQPGETAPPSQEGGMR